MRTQQEKINSMYFRQEIHEQIGKCFLEFGNMFANNVVSKLIDRIEHKQRDISRILESLNRLQVQYQKLLMKQHSVSKQQQKPIKNHSDYVSIEQSSIEIIQFSSVLKQVTQDNHEDLQLRSNSKLYAKKEQSELEHQSRSMYISKDCTSVGQILKHQISKYPMGSMQLPHIVQRQTSQSQQPLSHQQSFLVEQIPINKPNIGKPTTSIHAAQFQLQPGLYQILQSQSISRIDFNESQNNVRYIQQRVQSWPREYQFIKPIKNTPNNNSQRTIDHNHLHQGRFLFTVIQDQYQYAQLQQQQYYSIGFGGYRADDKSSREKIQLIIKQNTKFFYQYKRYQSDFKSVFFVKRIMISNCLPLQLFTGVLNTEWTQLEEIIYYHDNRFDDQIDFSYLVQVLSSMALKHVRKLYVYVDLLTPIFAQTITEAEAESKAKIQVWVGKLPKQTYLSLKNIMRRSDTALTVKFQVPARQFNPNEKLSIVTMSVMQFQQNHHVQKLNRLISLDINTLNEKKNLIAIQWQRAKDQSLDFLISQQNSISTSCQSSNDLHRFEHCGYTLTTYPGMNLTDLFTQFMWSQVTRVNFTQLHDSEQWRVFMQESYRFSNLRIIEIENVKFDISKLKAQGLRGFKSLKYLIADKRAVDMIGRLHNELDQNPQTINNKLQHLEYLCELIPTLRIVLKTGQRSIQSESVMRTTAIRSRFRFCVDDYYDVEVDKKSQNQQVTFNNSGSIRWPLPYYVYQV